MEPIDLGPDPQEEDFIELLQRDRALVLQRFEAVSAEGSFFYRDLERLMAGLEIHQISEKLIFDGLIQLQNKILLSGGVEDYAGAVDFKVLYENLSSPISSESLSYQFGTGYWLATRLILKLSYSSAKQFAQLALYSDLQNTVAPEWVDQRGAAIDFHQHKYRPQERSFSVLLTYADHLNPDNWSHFDAWDKREDKSNSSDFAKALWAILDYLFAHTLLEELSVEDFKRFAAPWATVFGDEDLSAFYRGES